MEGRQLRRKSTGSISTPMLRPHSSASLLTVERVSTPSPTGKAEGGAKPPSPASSSTGIPSSPSSGSASSQRKKSISSLQSAANVALVAQRFKRRNSTAVLPDEQQSLASSMSKPRRQSVFATFGSTGGRASCKRLIDAEASEQQERAAKNMQSAMDDRDAVRLLSAISEAKTAGIDKFLVDSAVSVLQHLEIEEALTRAAKGKDAEVLRHAISRAKHADVDENEMSTAQHALEVLEAKEALSIAMRCKETGALKMNIKHAASMGVDPALIKEARGVLDEITASYQLMKALQASHPSIAAIEEALQKARASNMEGEIVQQAEEYLLHLRSDGERERKRRPSKIEHNDSAAGSTEDALLRAIESRETGILRMVLKQTEEAGPEHESLRAQAEAMLNYLESQILLSAALKKADRKKLTEAVDKAIKSGVRSHELEQARQILQQIKARDKLSHAITAKDESELVQSIADARLKHVEAAKIGKAEETLAQVRARRRLSVAMECSDVQELTDALQAAREKKIERRDIDKAETLLRSLMPRRKSVA